MPSELVAEVARARSALVTFNLGIIAEDRSMISLVSGMLLSFSICMTDPWAWLLRIFAIIGQVVDRKPHKEADLLIDQDLADFKKEIGYDPRIP